MWQGLLTGCSAGSVNRFHHNDPGQYPFLCSLSHSTPGPGASQESGGGGGGCGAAGRRGRLCVGGEGSGLGPDPGLRGPRTTRGCGALPAERGRGHRPVRPWRSWSWWRPMLRPWDHFILSFAPPAVAQLLVDYEGGASDPDRRRGYKV